MRRTRPIILTLLPLLLVPVACVTTTPPEPEEIRSEAIDENLLPDNWQAGDAAAAAVTDGWLATFDDPELEALVTEAIENNPDLAIAASRLDRAAAFIGVARAELYPAIGVKARGTTKLGDGLDNAMNGILLGATWELDLWGRVRYGRTAAVESFAATQSDYLWARRSIAAATATSWFLATETLLQKSAAEEMLADAEGLLELANTRLRVGVGDERDVVAAEASISSYRDNLLKLSLAHENAVRALEMLLGRYPGAALAPRSELPPMPGPVPAGIPLNALERRPDVIAAERRVASAFSRVGEARAARLPRISLTASGGYADSEVVELVPAFENPFASLGAGLLAPIFLGGQLAAQVDVRTAEQRQSIEEYSRTALRALYEVEIGLAAEANLREREEILKTSVAQNERALELEKIAFRVGKSDMRRVLGQQLALSATRLTLIRVQGERLTQRVNLHLALGGSFEIEDQTQPELATSTD